jgi:hypothetical protein
VTETIEKIFGLSFMRISLYRGQIFHFPTSPISERLPVRYLKHWGADSAVLR